MSKTEKKCILLQITGSIAAFKAAALASMLVNDNYEVQCVVSEGGLKFVGTPTFEGLTGKTVLTDMFQEGRALDHINLADWADLLLLYPASANHLTRLRAGLADDLIGALFLANNFRKPYWIAPAMNSQMFAHPAVSESLERLEHWGCRVLPTGEGRLACGTVGYGRLLEPEATLKLVREAFA